MGGRLTALSAPEGLCFDGRRPPGSPLPGDGGSVGTGQEQVLSQGGGSVEPGPLESWGLRASGERGQRGKGQQWEEEKLWEGKGGDFLH